MLNQKKRKRRKKKNGNLLTVPTIYNNANINNTNPTPITATIKPKLKKSFVTEEIEVKAALQMRQEQNKGLDPSVSLHIEKEIAFFTEQITLSEFDKHGTPTTDPPQTPISSNKTNDPDGPQLASSYILVDEHCYVEKNKKTKCSYDDALLFLPHLKVTRRTNNNERNSAIEALGCIEDEGHFVWDQPQIFPRNLAQMINRLYANNSNHLISSDKSEFLGLRTFGNELDRLFKSDSSQTFNTFLYSDNHKPSTITSADEKFEQLLKIQITEIKLDNDNENVEKEECLAKRIEELHKQYLCRIQSNCIQILENRLASLRHILQRTHIEAIYLQYKSDLRDTRSELHREHRTNRKLLQSILEHWTEIKALRAKQGFNKTALKVVIKIEECDKKVDEEKWEQWFETELTEMLDESLELYKSEMEKQQINKPKEDCEIERLKKPNVDNIQKEIYKILTESYRRPGEPKIFVELHKIDIANGRGNHASFELGTPKYFIQIMIDGKIVTTIRNSEQFANRIVFNALTSIKLMKQQCSVNISVILLEQQNREIGKMFLPLPEQYESFEVALINQISFTSTRTTNAVSGKIGIKIGWSNDQKQDESKENYFRRSNGNRHLLHQNNEVIKNWFDEQMLDPMDPEAASLIESINTGTYNPLDIQVQEKPVDYFRLNEDLTAFCSEEEMNSDKRLNMLIARFNHDAKFKDYKFIPHSAREIQIVDADIDHIIEDFNWMDPIDIQRHRGKKYLKNVYQMITNHCEIINKNFDSHDLMFGNAVPTFRSFIGTIVELFGPKRPLNPQKRKTASIGRVNFRPMQMNKFKVIVNVIRANGVPYRNVESQIPSPARRSSILSSVACIIKNQILKY